MNPAECYKFNGRYKSIVESSSIELKRRLNRFEPEFGITLGSGLQDLAERIKQKRKPINYETLGFPEPSVQGHTGKIIIGELGGVPVIGLQGRVHYYEGADLPYNCGMLRSVFPIHVLANLGIKNYFSTNAVGGLNLEYGIGDLMIIKSHISQFMPNPLAGRLMSFPRVDDGNPIERFQPMNQAYDSEYIRLFKRGKRINNHIREGTLIGVTGPTYETSAECLAFRDQFKADAVGMSTIPEITVANNRGMRCIAISCITNKIARDGTNATNHLEVMKVLNKEETRKRIADSIEHFFNEYKEHV